MHWNTRNQSERQCLNSMRQLSLHVEMKNNKLERRKLSRTVRALYYWGKCVGLVTFTLSKSNELKCSYPSTIYSFILSAFFCYTIYGIAVQRYTIKLPGDTPIGIIFDCIGLICTSLELFSIWFVFAFRHNGLREIIRCFVRVEEISAKLSIADNYEESFVQLRIQLTSVTLVIVVWAFLINWAIFGVPDWTNYVWTLLSLFTIPSYHTLIFFLWIVIVVRQKFHRLNKKAGGLIDENRERLMELGNRGILELSRTSYDSSLLSRQIDNVSQLHRGLRDTFRSIEEHFALVMFLNVTKQFSQIALNVHVVYHYMKGIKSMTGHDFCYVISLSTYNVTAMIVMLLVSNVCGSTSEEANYTGNVVHAMLNKHDLFRENRETAKFNILFLDLLQNRVRLTLFGFLEMNYHFVYGVAVMATMYFTIMLQFYG